MVRDVKAIQVGDGLLLAVFLGYAIWMTTVDDAARGYGVSGVRALVFGAIVMLPLIAATVLLRRDAMLSAASRLVGAAALVVGWWLIHTLVPNASEVVVILGLLWLVGSAIWAMVVQRA